jgi:hypothetical protein
MKVIHRRVRTGSAALAAGLAALALLAVPSAQACTACYVAAGGRVLVGNNEDFGNPATKVWFVPRGAGTYGRMYFGFEDLSSQGGVNEKGLWFDAFGLPSEPVATAKGEIYPGNLQDRLLADCATVAEVLKMLKRYSRAAMTRYQWMFGDRTGASAIIEGDAVIPIKGRYQVVTNFRQSEHPGGEGYECHRFRVANAMLASQPEVGIDEVRRVLAATHSEGQDPTVYSYIADLKRGVVYLYHFHNFENVVVLDVAKELEKGAHVYDLPEMFPKTVAAMTFDYLARKELADKKAARLDPNVDAATFPRYAGRYRVTAPETMAGQTITISAGKSQLYLQLNDGGKYEVLPDSPTSFFLLGYGGTDLSCRFTRAATEKVTALAMEGGGLALAATRVE